MALRHAQGIVLEGYRVASGTSSKDPLFNEDGGTIRLQVPEFQKRGLDFNAYFGEAGFFYGTLDLSFAPQIVCLRKPEFCFKGIRWTNKFDKPDQPPFVENFFLSKARVFFEEVPYLALLYIPDPATKPGHFQSTSAVEVIAAPILGIGYNSVATLEYDDIAISLADV